MIDGISIYIYSWRKDNEKLLKMDSAVFDHMIEMRSALIWGLEETN